MKYAVGKLNSTVFVLRDPMPWALRYGDRPTLNCPVLIQGSFNGNSPVGIVHLLDVNGGIEIGPLDVRDLQVDLADAIWAVPPSTLKLLQTKPSARPSPDIVLSTLAAECAAEEGGRGPWCEFERLLNHDRFEASAWFERDRRHLALTDQLTGRAVVSLWDEEVSEVIEDGFLKQPRVSRPSDNDWLEPLMQFAQDKGLLPLPQLIAHPAAAPRHYHRESHA